MPSYKSYMALKVDGLRRELASRDLPTEGLKKDLVFRLASSDHDSASLPLRIPHPTSALASVTSNKEVKSAKMGVCSTPTTDSREKDSKRSSPSQMNSSLPFVPDHSHGDEDRHIRNLARISTAFNNALLSILLITFLSCTLWQYLPATDKEYLILKIPTGHDFVYSKINVCQDFISSNFNNGQLLKRILTLSVAFMELVKNKNHSLPIYRRTGKD